MLRVRPLVHTADLPRAAAFLQALGLTPAADPVPNDSYAVFDAGSGRVTLRACAAGSAEEGSVDLTFDVGDVREFARRTAEAGTAVRLSEERGLAARIEAPDGASLLAAAGPRETRAPASPLSVVALWHSTAPAQAVRVLTDIGAKPRIGSDPGTRHAFRAKNGGLVTARAGSRTAVGLAFEYEGEVRDLLPGLIGGGFEPAVVDEGSRASLRVLAPWGTEVRVHERQPDA
jgi:hypothetical protein